MGPAANNWQHGRYSKHLPTGLAKNVREAEKDPALASLHQDAALLDGLMVEVMDALKAGETVAGWREVASLSREALQALDASELDACRDALVRLIDAYRASLGGMEERDRLVALIRERANVVSREWKRLEVLGQMMTQAEVLSLIGAIGQTIRAHVQDPHALRGIADDLRGLVAGDYARVRREVPS